MYTKTRKDNIMKTESYQSIKKELLNYAEDEIKHRAEHQELEDFENAEEHFNI